MGKSRRTTLKRKNSYFVRRDRNGRFQHWVSIGRSLQADRRVHAVTVVPSGQGDRGDQRRRLRSVL